MDTLQVSLSLIGVLALLVYKYFSWYHGIFQKIGLDGPKPSIFFGNFPSAITGKQPIVYDVDLVYRKYKKTHHAIGVFMTRYPQILLLDPKLAQEVMVTNFGKYRGNFSSNWIYSKKEDKIAARNAFFTSDDSWKRKRSETIGGLTQNKLNLAYPIWKGCTQKLSKYLREETVHGNAIIETKNLGFCFTANILGEFLWGIETNTLTTPDDPNTFLQMTQKWLRYIFVSLERYFKFMPLPWLRCLVQRRLYSEETDTFFSRLTKDAFDLRERDINNQNREDYLNYMLHLKERKKLSHDDIVGHMLTTLLDGFETSATVIFHTLFYLAHHPQFQEKLRKEILDNLEDDSTMTYQKLSWLPYLDQCTNECIRLLTVVSFYARICTEPTELEVDNGHIIPINVGQVVSIPIFSYHHDADYFPEPYEFNPERFNNGAHTELMKRGIFMPFGNGPRICLGMHLGLLQVKSCLVEILKEYRLKCCAKTIPEKKPDSSTFIMGVEGEFWLEYERL